MAFTKAQAIGALVEFAKKRQSQTEKMVFESDFEIQKETLLSFKLLNKVQFDIFYELKQELLDFLRQMLENSDIQADAIITAIETKAKPRTEQEKFEAMSNKNSKIWKLKDTLDLDLLF